MFRLHTCFAPCHTRAFNFSSNSRISHNSNGPKSRITFRGIDWVSKPLTRESVACSRNQAHEVVDRTFHEAMSSLKQTPNASLDPELLLEKSLCDAPDISNFSSFQKPSVAALITGSVILCSMCFFLFLDPSTAAPLLAAHPDNSGDWLKFIESRVREASEAAEAAGPLAPLYYGLLYIGCAVLLLPASFLTLGAGYIFGVLQGTAIVSLASTTAASLSFLIARYIARPLVQRQLAKSSKFALVDSAIAQEGAKIVFLWRLSPLFPFGASNYMFGLTAVKFWPYVAASWAAMLPATFTYVYLGSVGRATVDAISSDTPAEAEPLKVALYIVGALATLLVTREVSSLAAKALKEAEGSEQSPPGP